jgi:P4 family phage/plasmid primase-like protien
MSQNPREGSSSPPAPKAPQANNDSSVGGFIKNTVHIKDGLVLVGLTPILRLKVATLRASGDPVGEILYGELGPVEGSEWAEWLRRVYGHRYDIYAFRVSGECFEAESKRFWVKCLDLSVFLEPGVVGPTRFEAEGLLRGRPHADPSKLRVWVERLLELDRELSEADSKVVELLALSELPRDKLREAVRGAVNIICVEGLRTTSDGRPAPLPTYTFECAKTLESELNIKKWMGRLYILFGGKWLGEPESTDILQAIMVRTYEAHGFYELNWKYSTFEKETLYILRAKAENAEPVRGVKSGDYLIAWRDGGYEVKEYRGEFVIHDIMARVRVGLLNQAKAKGYNARQLAEAETPKLVEILRSWVGEPYWLTLLEIVGYTTIAFEYPLHKAFMLLGKGSNGKSTYLRMLKDILGRHNVASIPLQAFTSLDYRFLWATLVGRLANIFADLPKTPLSYTGIFKVLTGEDDLILDRKGKEPIRGYTNYAKMIFSANELPETRDLTHAFFRRWILIDFPNIFPEDPGWYERNITPEVRDQALTVGLEAMREVLERRAFTGESDVKERWLEESDPIYRFVRDLERLNLARRSPGGMVPEKALFEVYTEWARIQGVNIVAKQVFTREIEKYGITKGGPGKKYYTGIMLLERPDVVKAKLRELLEEGEEGGLEVYQ